MVGGSRPGTCFGFFSPIWIALVSNNLKIWSHFKLQTRTSSSKTWYASIQRVFLSLIGLSPSRLHNYASAQQVDNCYDWLTFRKRHRLRITKRRCNAWKPSQRKWIRPLNVKGKRRYPPHRLDILGHSKGCHIFGDNITSLTGWNGKTNASRSDLVWAVFPARLCETHQCPQPKEERGSSRGRI